MNPSDFSIRLPLRCASFGLVKLVWQQHMKRCLGSTRGVRADGRAAPGTVWVEGDWYEDWDGSGAWSTPLVVADAYEDADADKDASNLTASEIAVAKILEPVRRRRRWQLRRGNGWWERRPWQRWERWAAHIERDATRRRRPKTNFWQGVPADESHTVATRVLALHTVPLLCALCKSSL